MDSERKTALVQKIRLQRRLLVLSFVNLGIVSLLGVLLRSFPFLPEVPFSYQNLLHGHSHFAFGGWMTPVLLALVMKHFHQVRERVAYRHWRNIALLILFSAYGMLLAFPVQGYAPVSIAFSTLSIVATVYWALVVAKATQQVAQTTSIRFLNWGLLYACLSAAGPFATGPIVAMGKGGSPLYFDAIYFYLHFQYNGFFTFLVLAVLYRWLEQNGNAANGPRAFLLFNSACLPTYALSLLWSQPSGVFNGIGAVGACLQAAGAVYLLKDVWKSRIVKTFPLLRLSLSAFVLKLILQVLSALPAVALLAYTSRNFVIAYLHLVLLGFISLFVFALEFGKASGSRFALGTFLFSFVSTEVLLVLNAASSILPVTVPYFPQLLLFCSLFFPAGIAGLCWRLRLERAVVPKRSASPVLVS